MEIQLLTVMAEWTKFLERYELVDVVYFNFQKAFGIVPHIQLFELIKYYHVKNSVVTWIMDVLTGRKQEVLVDGIKPSIFGVTSGVSQGSVLSSLLILICVKLMV